MTVSCSPNGNFEEFFTQHEHACLFMMVADLTGYKVSAQVLEKMYDTSEAGADESAVIPVVPKSPRRSNPSGIPVCGIQEKYIKTFIDYPYDKTKE